MTNLWIEASKCGLYFSARKDIFVCKTANGTQNEKLKEIAKGWQIFPCNFTICLYFILIITEKNALYIYLISKVFNSARQFDKQNAPLFSQNKTFFAFVWHLLSYHVVEFLQVCKLFNPVSPRNLKHYNWI